jgi:hypothetical protein
MVLELVRATLTPFQSSRSVRALARLLVGLGSCVGAPRGSLVLVLMATGNRQVHSGRCRFARDVVFAFFPTPLSGLSWVPHSPVVLASVWWVLSGWAGSTVTCQALYAQSIPSVRVRGRLLVPRIPCTSGQTPLLYGTVPYVSVIDINSLSSNMSSRMYYI